MNEWSKWNIDSCIGCPDKQPPVKWGMGGNSGENTKNRHKMIETQDREDAWTSRLERMGIEKHPSGIRWGVDDVSRKRGLKQHSNDGRKWWRVDLWMKFERVEWWNEGMVIIMSQNDNRGETMETLLINDFDDKSKRQCRCRWLQMRWWDDDGGENTNQTRGKCEMMKQRLFHNRAQSCNQDGERMRKTNQNSETLEWQTQQTDQHNNEVEMWRCCWLNERGSKMDICLWNEFWWKKKNCLFWIRYLVDPASSHMLVLKIKPCMPKYR